MSGEPAQMRPPVVYQVRLEFSAEKMDVIEAAARVEGCSVEEFISRSISVEINGSELLAILNGRSLREINES